MASAEQGPAADLIAAVLAVTPTMVVPSYLMPGGGALPDRRVVIGGADAEPIVAAQLVTALRWLANADYDQSAWTFEVWVEHLADAIEAAPRTHEWAASELIVSDGACDYCVTCGVVRRRDDANPPCRGPIRVELREATR